MATAWTLERAGVRLAGDDYPAGGPAVVLLHGLAGYGGEWAPTARALADRARVVAIDARGHGRSERRPADLSPEAHVGDAAFVIEELRLGEAIVVGQSYGGLTAFLLAAERPDLVSGLVVIEATPASDDESVVTAVEQGLRAWPVPFRSRAAAVEFFEEPAGEAWAGGLEQRADGWWPRFDVDVMAETLRGAIDQSRWDLWGRIRSPTLVVRGENGALTRDDARAMADALAEARWIEIPGAGHNVHLDQPEAWVDALSDFVDGLGG